MHDNYVHELHLKFSRKLDEISAEYNFDLGDEFEVAICSILRAFLPEKYGVCRGFVVDRNGEKAGFDDEKNNIESPYNKEGKSWTDFK